MSRPFQLSDFFADLVHGNNTAAHRNQTLRLIDDALDGGQKWCNRTAVHPSSHRFGHLGHSVSHVARTIPNVSVVAVSKRFKKMYKQVHTRTKPGRLGCDGTVASTRVSSCVSVWVYPFWGGKSCPVSFSRIQDWCCHALSTFAGLAASHCVDDVLVVDRQTTILSGWLFLCSGSTLSMDRSKRKKGLLPAQIHRILGAVSDLSQAPAGHPTFTITQDRGAHVSHVLQYNLESGRQHPGVVGK